jgi:drug/metabolite transporter (DMT)-like permease
MLYFPKVIIMKNKLRGSLSLAFATIIWGSAFIAQSVGMDYIGPITFQAARCGLGAIFLLPVIFIFDQDKKSYFKKWADPKLWKTGFFCGCALFVAADLQQVGLVYTTAGKAGFITAMYIVLVPILGLALRKKPPVTIWFSVLLAVVGLYLLSCADASTINIGDVLMLGCALGFAVQITLVDRLAGDLDGLRLNCIQALVCSLLSAVVMVFTETPTLSGILACALPIGYAGILSMGVAYSLQIIGQKYLEPTPASLIMSLESVFAALCGWLFLNEQMSLTELCGCGLVFAAVILSQLPEKKRTHG